MLSIRLLICRFCALLVLSAAVVATPAQAGVLDKLFVPKARLWPHWVQHDPASNLTIDHSAWGSFLSANIKTSDDGVNRVDYGNVPAADRARLKAYIESMQAIRVSGYSREEQFAFWINLYNALTVDIVLDHYPVDSIRDIKLSAGWFSKGPWSKKLLQIDGKEVSLNDIEHRILRPMWQDPRIHYAVNCASIGCPNLITEPFTAKNSDRLLQAGAHDYINHPRGVRIENNRLHVSSIYVWFESDFGGEAGVIDHLQRYAEPKLAADLQNFEKIADNSYDWSLNDAN